MSQHITSILICLINSPHLSVSTFSFLAEAEKYTLLQSWGRGQRRTIPVLSIASIVEKQVMDKPNNTAIISDAGSITYQELWKLEKIAGFIMQRFPPQTAIGIYATRSIEMLAVILGVLKANAVYVPLDTKYPLVRINKIIKEAKMDIFLFKKNF